MLNALCTHFCTANNLDVCMCHSCIGAAAKGGKVSPIKYYAVALESAIAPMVLELGLASLRRKVKVYFIDDPSLNPPGCDETICRKLNGIVAIER